MILVITSELSFVNETGIINELFRKGLDLLHIRKPGISREKMIDFIEKIDQSFYPQLVLHQHYEVGENFRISRFHFREADRKEDIHRSFINGNRISTSVHNITTFNDPGKEWEYAFISPFFPSISKKGYGEDSTVIEEVKSRDNPNVKIIALGGIHHRTIQRAFETGVDGIALLGSVWQADDPVEAFLSCRKAISE